MEKINIAVSSFGNVGQAIVKTHFAQLAKNPMGHDMNLVGVIRRKIKGTDVVFDNVPVVDDIKDIKDKINVVICAAPSHCVHDYVIKFLNMGVSTVDCFDSHEEIAGFREEYDIIARKNQVVSVIASGWDPGFDSVQRAMFQQLSPLGETFTTFGPGRSMGHTTTAKAILRSCGIEGADTVSITCPGKTPGTHIRKLYISGVDASKRPAIEAAVQEHNYFIKNAVQETFIYFVDDISEFDTSDHAGHIENTGADIKVETKLSGNNPEMTANIMYSAARAAARMRERGQYGCKTMLEIAPDDYIIGRTFAERMQRIKY